jgi:hypothetical protein
MNKILFACCTFLLLINFSCKKDKDPSYLTIDNRTYELRNAYMYNYGFDIQNSTRRFSVLLADDSFEPETFIQFQIVSEDNSDERPSDAIYAYTFNPTEVFDFSYLQFARGVKYDFQTGEFDGGTFYFDNFCNTRVLNSTVDFQVNKRDYRILLEAEVVKNNDTLTIEAYHNGRISFLEYDFIDYVFEDCSN